MKRSDNRHHWLFTASCVDISRSPGQFTRSPGQVGVCWPVRWMHHECCIALWFSGFVSL